MIMTMQILLQNGLFLGFSAMLLISALCVITLSHPVRSALSLVVCFFSATGLWLLLDAEFLGLVLILVYVGAVMTLFLFVVMTLNMESQQLKSSAFKIYVPAGLGICALLTALLIVALKHSGGLHWIHHSASDVSNTVQIGKVLYTEYMLPFEISAVILLVAMVSAISLTLFVPISRKIQKIDAQIKTKKEDRIKLIKDL